MFDVKKFGGYLSRLRKNADMTQMELADRLNLTRQAVSRYEHGDSFPDVSILVAIADIFRVTLDELINSGTPTRGESVLLKSTAQGREPVMPERIEDVLSLAPYLRPSVLSRLSTGLLKQGIDISGVVALAEYLNDESTVAMLENARFEGVSHDLLEKLMPLLDRDSRYMILQKILEGEMDWHFLRVLIFYTENLTSQIEAAVVEGALPWEALELLRQTRLEMREKYHE
ncbi:MAG: helix-turn-helix domain-containing protein [Acetatifactor sp.]|nr:helix-turn-helix domain-containing protein [Acetatifactor sp.]MDE7354851.1 helix-turn-helix domain-containing protein [Acetatifactor sp.]